MEKQKRELTCPITAAETTPLNKLVNVLYPKTTKNVYKSFILLHGPKRLTMV